MRDLNWEEGLWGWAVITKYCYCTEAALTLGGDRAGAGQSLSPFTGSLPSPYLPLAEPNENQPEEGRKCSQPCRAQSREGIKVDEQRDN